MVRRRHFAKQEVPFCEIAGRAIKPLLLLFPSHLLQIEEIEEVTTTVLSEEEEEDSARSELSSSAASHVVTAVITPAVNRRPLVAGPMATDGAPMHSVDCILAESRPHLREPVSFPEYGRDLVDEELSASASDQESCAEDSPGLLRNNRRRFRSLPHQLALASRSMSWEDNWLFSEKRGMKNYR